MELGLITSILVPAFFQDVFCSYIDFWFFPARFWQFPDEYHHVPDSLKDKIKLEEISEGRLIDEDIYLNLVNYLEEKIIGKDFENINTRDAGVSISGNINNNSFNINNLLIDLDLHELNTNKLYEINGIEVKQTIKNEKIILKLTIF